MGDVGMSKSWPVFIFVPGESPCRVTHPVQKRRRYIKIQRIPKSSKRLIC